MMITELDLPFLFLKAIHVVNELMFVEEARFWQA